MVKRAKTPPLDDGAKFLTVLQPYPFRPDMEHEGHQKRLAWWIASCIDAAYFRCFYYRIISPGAVILEVDKGLGTDGFNKLLGAHKWGEFLNNPGDQAGLESKIFYCTYSSGREVQKHGWKRVDVTDAWVMNQKAINKLFVSPYPQSQWCAVPRRIDDVIQNDLCRPLPTQQFPPPPPTKPAPVVGTAEWQRQRDAPAGVRGPSKPQSSGSTPQTVPGTPAIVSPPPSSASSVHHESLSGSDDPLSPVTPNDRILSIVDLALEEDEDDADYDYFDGNPVGDIPLDPSKYPVMTTTAVPEKVTVVENLWADYAEEGSDDDYEFDDEKDDDQEIMKEVEKDDAVCRVHGVVCAKGVCKFQGKLKREAIIAERNKEMQKMREESARKRAAREEKIAKKFDQAGDSAGARQPPSHLRPTVAGRKLPSHLQAGAPPLSPGTSVPWFPVDITQESLAAPPPDAQSSVGWSGPQDRPQDWAPAAGPKAQSSAGWDGPKDHPQDWDDPSPPTQRPAPQTKKMPAHLMKPKQMPAHIRPAAPPPTPPTPPALTPPAASPPPPAQDWGAFSGKGKGRPNPASGTVKTGSWTRAQGPAVPAAGGARPFATAWGKAPSISASSAARNHDSWSESAPSEAGDAFPALNDAASTASSVRSQSRGAPSTRGSGNGNGNARAGPSAARGAARAPMRGWGMWGKDQPAMSTAAPGAGRQDGPWGNSDAVRAARPPGQPGAAVRSRTWAEEMDDYDGRSVAPSTISTATWAAPEPF
ncbi:uncharacterized protein BXZ73DRAFT_76835 [Epithele typhae]|uniref:uncharacterized protein n=1 Tax=Epithele typhae TaxID=378194 RepID=UPI002007D036|nr:uncharacterized protein BXZ73DRAFT_76835 [Epithele typhae]KAH9935126.1 hypothetical protein BXZ73DRAFT_76835 [Epithele typhae]